MPYFITFCCSTSLEVPVYLFLYYLLIYQTYFPPSSFWNDSEWLTDVVVCLPETRHFEVTFPPYQPSSLLLPLLPCPFKMKDDFFWSSKLFWMDRKKHLIVTCSNCQDMHKWKWGKIHMERSKLWLPSCSLHLECFSLPHRHVWELYFTRDALTYFCYIVLISFIDLKEAVNM